MNSILALGRYLFAIPILIFGIFHLVAAGEMTEMVPLPGGVFWVYLTGVALILAGISIIIKKHDRLASFLLGIMLLVFALSIHLQAAMDGDAMNFLKDVALAGGAFAYGLLATPEE
ncbi:MAG: DoxX family protein [Saprospirales bacterium]|nr:MAG: DoxX family protein [Saprospirales bacterium]